jgi:hypothetical protein
MLELAPTIDSVVAYLAVMSRGDVALVVPGGDEQRRAEWIAAYAPDRIGWHDVDGTWRMESPSAAPGPVPGHGAEPRLHPDLALLLTTSGSTGSPKLVRLSSTNVRANAEQIAHALDLHADDRAITSLPLNYSYGLSVLHSHLLVGASVVLTDASVVDPCFWSAVEAHGVTTLAGVPYTFDLLDRVQPSPSALRTLRLVTQAGGRLDPDAVARHARRFAAAGADLRVMYGQTEATARIAISPPGDAALHPDAVGRAVAGTTITIDDGEVVVRGPQVMLGYAGTRADLALGRTVDELRTGDLGVVDDGRLRITGRRRRIAKVFGLRLDLDRVERLLADSGFPAICWSDDRRLSAVVQADAEAYPHMLQRIRGITGLPPGAVRVHPVADLPRTESGKPAIAAAQRLMPADDEPRTTGPAPTSRAGDALSRLQHEFAVRLGRTHVGPEATFVALGGDSLSFVEMSIVVERELGDLPRDWHLLPLRDLAARARSGADPSAALPDVDDSTAPDGARARIVRTLQLRRIETQVVLRSAAIVLIVAAHVGLVGIRGGAHLLIGIAGFNLARFALIDDVRRARVRRVLTTTMRVAIPSMLWLGLVAMVSRDYPLSSALLLTNAFGAEVGDAPLRYWFIEAFVYLNLFAAALVAVPALDRLERRSGPWFALGLVAVGMVTRYDVAGAGSLVGMPEMPIRSGSPIFLVWLFALGWAMARSRTPLHRVVVSAAVIVTCLGFSPNATRVAVVVGGLLLLTWLPSMSVPAALQRPLGRIAAASLAIYLLHWQVYPLLDQINPVLAVAASVVVGVLVTESVARATRRLRRHRRSVAPIDSPDAPTYVHLDTETVDDVLVGPRGR